MNALRTKLIACKLDYHWYFIRKYRKQMVQLYEREADLSDERLLLINEKFNNHCIRATELDSLFFDATTFHNT